MHYRICVQGHLDQTFQERLEGLSIELPDQAALHGLLIQIVRLGLVLLSLETSTAKGEEEAAERS
jgi:hypothetical protein